MRLAQRLYRLSGATASTASRFTLTHRKLLTASVGALSATAGFILSSRPTTNSVAAAEAAKPSPSPPPLPAPAATANATTPHKDPTDLASAHVSAQSLAALRSAFKEYDINGDGHITVEEMRTVLNQKHVLSEQQAAARGELIGMFELADLDHDGTIDFEEFVKTIKMMEELKLEFKKLDTNHDGKLTAHELTPYVEKNFNVANGEHHTGEELIRRATGSKRGQDRALTFSEFAQLFIEVRRHHFSFKRGQKPITKPVNASMVGLDTAIDKDVAAAAGLGAWLWVDAHVGIKDGLVDVSIASDSILMQMFLAGSSCGTATCVTLPVDVVKTRMQLNARKMKAAAAVTATATAGGAAAAVQPPIGFASVAAGMYKNEGIRSFYAGGSASLLRAYTYSAMRLAFYDPFKTVTGADIHPTLLRKIAAGVLSGSLAATLSNPIEVIKIRMQADPKRYRNTIVGLIELGRSEGMSGFSAGLAANVLRGGAITAAQISSYDACKNAIKDRGYLKEGLPLHFCAALMSGFISTAVSGPFDTLRSSMMNANKKAGGEPFFKCIGSILGERGVRGLFVGFFPSWARLGPHTVISLVSFEFLRGFFGLKPM